MTTAAYDADKDPGCLADRDRLPVNLYRFEAGRYEMRCGHEAVRIVCVSASPCRWVATPDTITITAATLAEAVAAFEERRSAAQARGQDLTALSAEHCQEGVRITARMETTEDEDA